MNKTTLAFTAPERQSTQAGFTLVELMVAMVIGIIVLGIIGTLFLNSRQTYLAQDANARLQENARYATELLSRQIRMAGYNSQKFDPRSPSDLFANNFNDKFTGVPIAGTNGAGVLDTITLSFDTNKDCLGQPTTRAINRFSVNASQQLECQSGGAVGVVLEDVEAMQVLYRKAGSTTYDTAGAMDTVTGVRVCLLLRAKADVKNSAVGRGESQTYVDCFGASQTKSDGYMRRAVTMTVALRNRIK